MERRRQSYNRRKKKREETINGIKLVWKSVNKLENKVVADKNTKILH